METGSNSYTGSTKTIYIAIDGPVTETANFYTTSGFLAPLSVSTEFKRGMTIPVKVQLQDQLGNYVSDVQTQIYVDDVPGVSSGHSNTGNFFRYDQKDNQYIFNLNTKALEKGEHTIEAKLDNNEIIASITITLW